jgi:uncharacterized damage-inducible protein DinB
MKYIAIAGLALLSVIAGTSQDAKNSSSSPSTPVVAAVQQMEARFSKNLIGAADEMPAAKYNYRPTPEQITFAHLMTHVAESNNALCAIIAGESPRDVKLNESDTKEVLQKAVQDSFTYCERVLAAADDSKLGQTFTLGSQTGTRASALIHLVAGWADHYSAAAMYLRLNNILPPSANKAEKK